MPVAVRLIEVLAIVTLVATMAAGAAIVIFMEKCLWFFLMVTEPLAAIINLVLAALQYIFLVKSYGNTSVKNIFFFFCCCSFQTLLTRLTVLMNRLAGSLWTQTISKCPEMSC